MPLAILHPNFDCDLRLGFRGAISRLFDGLRLFRNCVAATAPIERLPTEQKTRNADVLLERTETLFIPR